MFDNQQIIDELGIGDLSTEQQQIISDEYRSAVGEILAGDLSQEKLDEFEAITNGDQQVIHSWLEDNAPDFKSNETYLELLENQNGAEGDGIPADKVFASIAWVQKNSPDFSEKVQQVRERLVADIQQYR